MSATHNLLPDARDGTHIICSYLNEQHVLTLCCQDAETLWCANIFYMFEQETMSFLVMTDTKTRHGHLIENNPSVAGTVSDQNIDIVELKGVQFSGQMALLIGDREDAARHYYYDRFPVAKLIPSPIWRITLDEVKMTDNSAGFANKYIWTRKS